MVPNHHIFDKIHHKLTSNLPPIFTQNSRNPLKNTSKTSLLESPPRQKKMQILTRN
jgi:hypothetical protein